MFSSIKPTPTLQENKTTAVAPNQALRLESIDGLRGVACLMVLALHCWVQSGHPDWPRLAVGPIHLTLSHIFGYGYGGVDLFFVLSGFCLAYPIMLRPDRLVNWKQYAANRARRILPPYWAALVMFGTFALVISHYRIEPFFSTHLLEWPKMRQLVYAFLLISVSLNATFWTLALECRWYFVLPFLILIWRKFSITSVLICAVLVSICSILLFRYAPLERLAFLLTPLPTFLPLFALGMWGAKIATHQNNSALENFLVRHVRLELLVSLLLLVAIAPQTALHFFTNWERIVGWAPCLFFLLLSSFCDDQVKRLLSWRPLVAVGTFSYSLYLTHEPFVDATHRLTTPLHWSLLLQLFFSQCVLFPTLVVFGYLFFLVAEKPFLRRPVKKAIEAEQHGLMPTATAEAGSQ